jgi:hypothetical protein
MGTSIVNLHSMFYWCQAVAPAPHGKIMSTLFHAHAFNEVVHWTIISFVSCLQGICNLNIPAAITFCPSVKVSGMDLGYEFYDEQQGLCT